MTKESSLRCSGQKPLKPTQSFVTPGDAWLLSLFLKTMDICGVHTFGTNLTPGEMVALPQFGARRNSASPAEALQSLPLAPATWRAAAWGPWLCC